MIKQPTEVRNRVAFEVDRMLAATRAFVTFLPITENDVLNTLARPQSFELAVEITELLMAKFGHASQRTARVMSKRKPRLRGANTYDNSRARKAALESP